MYTNLIGMNQFADEGFLAAQLFIASANYLNKMSDSFFSCFDKPQLLIGEIVCALNLLWWDFIVRHHYQLKSQLRGNLMLVKFNYISPDELKINHQEAVNW